MSIFKRKKPETPQSGPKVFTPEDYSKLMNEQAPPEVDPATTAAEEPASPNFDSISPSTLTETNATPPPQQNSEPEPSMPGSSLTEDHPEKILPISTKHGSGPSSEELVDALGGSDKPRRTSPFDEDSPLPSP